MLGEEGGRLGGRKRESVISPFSLTGGQGGIALRVMFLLCCLVENKVAFRVH